VLEINNLSVNYGGIQALQDVSLTVNEGEVVTLIGANGAGKTTTLRTISRLLTPRSGQILYKGKNITNLRPAVMSRPKLLLLDEPSLGLAPQIVREIFKTIVEMNKSGVTILLVEQNATLALQNANRGYVMESGIITIEGQASDLLLDERVRQAYLG